MAMRHVAEWDKIRAQVSDWASEQGFVVYSIIPIVMYDVGGRSKPVKGQRKSDKQYLDSFVQRTGIDERTAAVGKEIVEIL